MTRCYAERRLRKAGFRDFHLTLCDHHRCHAEAAARLSGFEDCLAITLDGVGDGLSGSIWRFQKGCLELVKAIPSRVSLGIFFEHVTTLMNMRELEDEGKVMALANYAYPIPDRENPLMDLIGVEGMKFVSPYRSNRMFKELKKILWRFPSEQFAHMAQRVLEKNALELIKNAVSSTGITRVALAGGVFSNIKLNMKIAEQQDIERSYIFPHMGDGGLALGAAIFLNSQRHPALKYRFNDPYLGPRYHSGRDPGIPEASPGFLHGNKGQSSDRGQTHPGRRDHPMVSGSNGNRSQSPGEPDHHGKTRQQRAEGPFKPCSQKKGLVSAFLSEHSSRRRSVSASHGRTEPG